MTKLMAVKDKIVVEILKREKTDGGIIIPEAAINEPQAYGLVISKGEEVPETVQLANIILFAPFGGQDIVVEKKIYKVLGYGELYCVLFGADIKEFKTFSIGEIK